MPTGFRAIRPRFLSLAVLLTLAWAPLAGAAEPEDFYGFWDLTATLNYVDDAGTTDQMAQGDAVLMVTTSGGGDAIQGRLEFRIGPEPMQIPFASAEVVGEELIIHAVAGGDQPQAVPWDVIRRLLTIMAISGNLELEEDQQANMFALDPAQYGVDPTDPVVFEGSFTLVGEQISGRVTVDSDEDIGVLANVYSDFEGERTMEDPILPTADQMTTASEATVAGAGPGATDEALAGMPEMEAPEGALDDISPDSEEMQALIDEPMPTPEGLETAAPLPTDGAPPATGEAAPIVDLPVERDAVTRATLEAARAIAEREQERREQQLQRQRLQRLSTYEYSLTTPTREEALQRAKMRALRTTVGRIYFGNFILLGRTVLDPYLERNLDRFVARAEVLSRQQIAEGQERYDIVVSVDRNLLYTDLELKHFIDRPKYRPVMGVALERDFGGEVTPDTDPREFMQGLLLQLDMRVEETPLFAGAEAMNVAATEDLLTRARNEAQRLDIDVIVTGTLRATDPEQRIILFDERYFSEAVIDLQFIRVDNGEVLREFRGEFQTSRPTPQLAINDLSQDAIEAAISKMSEGFLEEWRKTMLDRTDYRLLITGVDDQALREIESGLRLLSPDLRIYQKARYGDAVVMNVEFNDPEPDRLIDFFRRSRSPQFRVFDSPLGRGHYEIRVL